MDDLITYLTKYGASKGIIIRLTRKLDPYFPSCARDNHVLINMRWHNKWEIPFSYAHELGHIINGDEGTNYYHSATIHSKTEFEANKTAIDILIDYAIKNDVCIDNPVSFCEQFGVPYRLEYVVALKLKNIM
ncbi:ImmA/IrrE family metallo-endopeptidase [Limosilactobacillus reuteri]|uniref:ImmA/IrrE family metallo-endopeptidase n=2 Tax=Limosilactobacillus reuteri TaxID=1598 RepID=UPI00081BE803|nr:ImmA/IrrE family metallo-endopeptidase [Limosilactobacillus reuteri]MCH5379865.1 ImmA/IrrE family metallo-endopeptidase [Limosilactobacillus reuteri]OCW63685.1 hypothetical protein BBP12_06305 [Limosilactobacillus reuteri]OCW65663.1 hypothetical protein BBP11_04870 [Limosilactobacillus reuteri]OCW66064.1 hypothetical protein BBP10_02770 [Limosilactobacillus reuteri]OCW68892.1 hypothetical protein BBP14_06480 [Limosilactobacillus reuteri]